ncbi:MAG: serine/threonine-protein kinase [Lachnospiraceae bacterium]
MDSATQQYQTHYKKITVLNEEHHVFIVQHLVSKKIYVMKELSVYNAYIYHCLKENPIEGIPRIIDLYHEDSSLFLIEEYISGEPLQEKIRSWYMTEKDAAQYIMELCVILNRLHSLNPPIIHRDIKPSNIMITSSNHIVLIDFNAAKFLTDPNMSDTVLLGTKGYAAPEQYGFGSSTQQTDIYAIGILLKEMSASLSTPTNKFDQIIDKCTKIDPSDRFQTANDLYQKIYTEPAKSYAPFPVKEPNLSVAPPGFRTRTPWHIFVAILGYAMIFWFSLTIESKDQTGLFLWSYRFVFLTICLAFVIIGTNYLNVRKIFPLCQHKNRFVRFLGVLLLDAAVFFILVFALAWLQVLITA